MTSYQDFIDKVKQDVSGYLTLPALYDYVNGMGKAGVKLYLAIHGTHAFVKLDVNVISSSPQLEGAELRDIELDCTLEDGRYFKLLASAMMPPRLPPMPNDREPLNYSRMFSSKEQRDIYFDGIAYTFEVEEERYIIEARQRQERFLTWFVKRMGGPEKES